MITSVQSQTPEITTVDEQQQMVRESLTCAFDELHTGKVNHDARNLFKPGHPN